MFLQLRYFWLLSLALYFSFFSCRNTSSPPCEPPHFKFAKEALLKQTNDAFCKSLICANGKTNSLHFNSLINLFNVTRSVTVSSLMELLTTHLLHKPYLVLSELIPNSAALLPSEAAGFHEVTVYNLSDRVYQSKQLQSLLCILSNA